MNDIAAVATAVEDKVKAPGPVAFDVHFDDGRLPASTLLSRLRLVATGVAYRLAADGWQTGVSQDISQSFNFPQPTWPVVVVTLRRDHVLSAVLHSRVDP